MRLLIMGMLMMALSACNLGNEASSENALETPLVYYAFFNETELPEGSIDLAGIILSPVEADTAPSSDVAENLRQSLELSINDSRNLWTSSNIEITSVTFEAGHASVALNGDIFGTGGLVLSAASSQLLLTVFANPDVETTIFTLNGETIQNLGISHSSQAKPADYLYTREEIQTFIVNNATQS
jgi:hypothetical protein